MKHGTAVSLRLAALVIFCAGGLAGCDNDFEAPSQLDSLRVLAVRPEPASGRPGITSKLTLTFVDAREPPDQAALQPREIQIAWLGGCHNPPTRQYFGCFPLLSQLAARLSPRVVETQTVGVPPGFFATTTDFEIPVPNDILTKAASMPGDPVHFGVSYAFFAVCAGELRARPDLENRIPLDCVDPATGAPRDHRDFVTGYTSLYTYDGFDNESPILDGLRFNDVAIQPAQCENDGDCASLRDAASGAFDVGCSPSHKCSPLVPPCAGKGCPEYLVYPEVDPSSAEALPNEAATEIVWSNYYTTAGSFDADTELVNDPASGFIADHGSYFHPPAYAAGTVSLWVTVHDQRGGAAVGSFDVLVR
jgi:hypothetical protein